MVKLAFADEKSADLVAEAAQNLMAAAHQAVKSSPDYAPGRTWDAEAVVMAVQGIFFADIWDQSGTDRRVELDPVPTMARCRGLGMGVGCAIASLPNKEAQNILAVTVLTAMAQAQAQREAIRKAQGK